MHAIDIIQLTSGVNFTSILVGNFTYRCQFHQHFTCTFFADILAPKNFKPKTQLCDFWRQNFVQKNVCVKYWWKWLQKCFVHFSVQTVWVCNFLAKGNQNKSYIWNVGEIDFRDQFHQRSMSSFYAHRSQKHKKTVNLSVFFAILGSVCVKAACRMLMKLTSDRNSI